jgi:hypothetical protein
MIPSFYLSCRETEEYEFEKASFYVVLFAVGHQRLALALIE